MGSALASCPCGDGLRQWVARDGRQLGEAAPGGGRASSGTSVAALPPPPPPAGTTAGLSKNQQKKLLQRQAKLERKGPKKSLKQSNALAGALESLAASLPGSVPGEEQDGVNPDGVRRRFCEAFGTSQRYRSLPLAFGPQLDEGLAILNEAMTRPPKYDAKFLPQEYSLLHKLYCSLGGECDGVGVLDIGAGNANCAVLASTLLGLTVICVERETPRFELRAELQLPLHLRSRIVRLEADVDDFDLPQLQEVAAKYGLRRFVLVAKHPCGIGVDRSIACAERLHGAAFSCGSAVDVVGAIIACCCTNKLHSDDSQVSRIVEFCDFHAEDLPAFEEGTGRAGLENTVGVMSRCSAWRTSVSSVGSAVHEDQLEWAELFEDAVQILRLRRLERLFGAATEVRFAPRECTPQDRCLIAHSVALPQGIFAHGDVADQRFLDTISKSCKQLLADTGPIDCRPRGIKSTKYGFDFTNGVVDDDEALRD